MVGTTQPTGVPGAAIYPAALTAAQIGAPWSIGQSAPGINPCASAPTAPYPTAAAGGVAERLEQTRPPVAQTVVPQLDRTPAILVADKDCLETLLGTLPDSYQMLNRQGIYGDFFSFYLCDIVLKMNGKGGQPVYIKLAGQDSGRCTPR